MLNGKLEYDENALFKGDAHNTYLNACVGENGGPYTLGHYADGFFQGAHAIVQQTRREHTIYVDVLVYPIAFNYRHGIELYLKQFLQHLIAFNQSKIEPKKNHNIDYYWKRCLSEIRKAKMIEFPTDAISEISRLVGYFCEFDSTGQVFRYPEDIKGNKSISGFGWINLGILADEMAVLGQHLNDFTEYLEEHLIIKADEEEFQGW